MDLDLILKQLREDEGRRGFAYDDATGKTVNAPEGKLTIGYGSNLQDVPLPEYIMELLLRDRVMVATLDAVQVFPAFATLNSRRQDVLVQMAYQLGRKKLAGFVKMLQALEDGMWDEAAREALNSLAAKQAPARWQRHAKVLKEGV